MVSALVIVSLVIFIFEENIQMMFSDYTTAKAIFITF